MGLRCNIDNLRLFEPLSGHKTRVNDKVDLYSYLRFCGKIMCTAGPNTYLGLAEATRMNASGFGMVNDDDFALFWTIGGVVGPRGGKTKKWRFRSYGDFGAKKRRFHLPAKQ